MKYTIRKKFKFEAAHQLFAAFSKDCYETIHGHSYVVEVFFSMDVLDTTGMVMDFGQMNVPVKEIINRWDHALIMPIMFPQDYLVALKRFNKKLVVVNWNPTAERMAAHLLHEIRDAFPRCRISVIKVRVHETETGYAEAE